MCSNQSMKMIPPQVPRLAWLAALMCPMVEAAHSWAAGRAEQVMGSSTWICPSPPRVGGPWKQTRSGVSQTAVGSQVHALLAVRLVSSLILPDP